MLLTAVFAVMVGYGVTLTVLPYYTSRVHELNGMSHGRLAVHIGVLTGVYALAQLVAGPAVGRLADRLGRRPVALIGLVSVGASQVGFALADSLPWLYALRIGGGIGASLLTVAATAAIADWTDEQSRPRGMALFGMAVSLGIVAGPMVGAALSGSSLGVFGWRVGGYALPFVAAGLVAFAAAVLVGTCLPESMHRGALVARDSQAEGLGPKLALVVAAQFGLAVFESTFVLYARSRYSFTTSQTTQAFFVCGIVMAVLQLVAAGPLQRWLASAGQIAAGFIAMAAGIALLLGVSTTPGVLGAVAVLAAGTALVTPNLGAVIAQGRPSAFGSALGLKSSASSVGQFLGPVVGGGLLAWGVALPYAVTSLLLGVTGLATTAIVAAERRNPT